MSAGITPTINFKTEPFVLTDNSWYTRGDKPPIGCKCLIHHACWCKDIYHEVKIAAITDEYLIVKEDDSEQHYYINQITFKPSKTEREKVIENMVEIMKSTGSANLEINAVALYNAGYCKYSDKESL